MKGNSMPLLHGESEPADLLGAGDRESPFSFTSSDGRAALEAEQLAGDLALDLVWATPDDVPEGLLDRSANGSHHADLDETPSP